MQIKIKWFPMSLFNLFLLRNNLILFYWFRWFSKKCLGLNSYICVVFFFFFFLSVNIMISWFVFIDTSVGEIAENESRHLQRLEDAGWNQSANLQTQIGLEWILSKHLFFVRRKAFKFERLFHCLLLKRSSALPTSFCWHVFSQPSPGTVRNP